MHILNTTIFGFEKIFTTETLFGHKIQYQLSGYAEVIDRKAFSEIGENSPEGREAIALRLNNEVVVPILERGKYVFLVEIMHHFSHAHNGYAFPHLHRVVTRKGRRTLERDTSSVHASKKLERACAGTSKLFHGCRVRPYLIKVGLWSKEVMKENLEMIEQNVVEAVRKSELYREAEEVSALVIYHDIMDIKERFDERSYKDNPLTIHVKRLDDAVRIKWRRDGYSDYRVYGYRYEGGIPGSIDEAHRGHCIANSASGEEETIDPLEPGHLVYYGFYIEGQELEYSGFLDHKSEMRTVRRGFVTFPVQRPARPDPVKEHIERVDIAALRARLQAFGEEAKTEAERRRERVADFLTDADFRLQSKELLDQMKSKWTEKVRQRGDLSEADRKERLEDIEDYFLHLEDQLKPYL